MNKPTEKGLVPELRFPEFKGEKTWASKSLGKIAKNLDSKRVPITQQDRIAGMTPYYGASGIIDYVKGHIFDDNLLCISEVGANLIARTHPISFPIEGKSWVNNHAHVLKFEKRCTQIVVENYLNSISLEDYLTGMAQPKLDREKLDIILIPLPPKIEEQQKIADCLSSLDELVSAHNQKLDALKAHKKGLMQQLFPAEGETIPKIRFTEFQDEWKEKLFGNIIKINSGKGFKASEYSNSGNKLLQIENVGYGSTQWNDNTVYLPEFYKNDFPELTLRQGDIVLALNWPVTNNELKIARIKKDDEPSILYQRVGKLEVLNDALTIDFSFQICSLFIKEFVINKSIGSDQSFISLRDLYAQKIYIPSKEEQKKIADCLSKLDELITAQNQKIDALKTHKKGLMQQLFPSRDKTGNRGRLP